MKLWPVWLISRSRKGTWCARASSDMNTWSVLLLSLNFFTVLFKHLWSTCCFICRPLISSTETQILVTTLGIRHWAKSTLTSTGWIETLVPLRPGSKQTLRDQMTRQKSREERKEFTEQLMRNYLIMQALKVSITI